MAMNDILMGLASFLATYLLHSTLMLALALAVHRLTRLGTGMKEAIWRTALVAPLLTASLTLNLAVPPLAGTLSWFEVREEIVREVEPVPPAAPSPLRQPAGRPAMIAGDDRASGASAAGPDSEPAAAAAAPPPPGPVVTQRRLELLVGLLAGAWLLIAGFLTLRWLGRVRAGRRLMAGRRPLASGPGHEALLRLTGRAAIEAPPLSVCDALGGPATLPSGEICVPAWALELPPAQLEALLAHELAHVERRDPWWLAVALWLESVFWLQPFNRLARRRLAGLAELHADARAARLTDDGRALAQCLAFCAERLNAGSMPTLAAAMARQGGALSERVRKLITDSTETGGISMSRKFFIFASVMVLVMVLPSVAVLANKSTESRGTTININESDNGTRTMNLSFTGDDMRMKLKASGDIVFAPDGSGLNKLGPGSELEVTQEVDGVKRRLVAEGTENGIDYMYYVNGDERPYDDEVRAWFAGIVPMVLRETAINAPERVDYLLDNGGHEAVLDEIALIRSDFARRHFIEAFVVTGRLPADVYQRLLEETSKLRSDFEMRNALGVIYDTQEPRGQDLVDLIVVADDIGSDFELRQLLGGLAKDAITNESVMSAYAKAAEGIGSDFELRQALEALMEAGGGPRAVIIALPVAKGIASDFEVRSLLEEAAPGAVQDEEASRIWLEAAGSIGSDFELRQALTEFANRQPTSVTTWQALFETARAIGSDHECASFLVEAFVHMPDDLAVEEAYRSVMETIGSDREYRRVARVLER